MQRVAYNVIKNALVPASPEALAVQAKLTVGSCVNVEIYQPRDTTLNNAVAVVFEKIAQALNMRVRNVRGWLAVATGRADLASINGRLVPVPWGTGPRDMNNDEFEVFFEDCIPVIEGQILPLLAPSAADDIHRMIERCGAMSRPHVADDPSDQPPRGIARR
jgi:hypothetical protein